MPPLLCLHLPSQTPSACSRHERTGLSKRQRSTRTRTCSHAGLANLVLTPQDCTVGTALAFCGYATNQVTGMRRRTTCTHMRTQTHIHIYKHAHTHAQAHTLTGVHTHRHTFTCARARTHTHTHTHTHTRTHTHAHTHTHTHTHTLSLAPCTHVLTHTCSHTHRHTQTLTHSSYSTQAARKASTRMQQQ